MNQLNSIIVEGVITEPITTNLANDVYKFQVSTTRTYKDKDGKEVEEKSQFYVKGTEHFMKPLDDQISLGREVRVVGRLKQEIYTNLSGQKFSEVFIMAEHIEFRPMKKQKFLVGYEETFTGHKEVEAESIEQAQDMVRELIESDKLDPTKEYEDHDVTVYLEV